MSSLGDLACQLYIAHKEWKASEGRRWSVIASTPTYSTFEGDNEAIAEAARHQEGGRWWHAVDLKRTLTFTALNGIMFVPSAHYWYQILASAVDGMDHTASAFLKTALDQFVFTPVFMAMFFCAMMIVEGQSANIGKKLSHDYLPTLVRNWGVWIPAQLINFRTMGRESLHMLTDTLPSDEAQLFSGTMRLIPLPYEVVWVNAVGLFWNAVMSAQVFKAPEDAPAAPTSTSSAPTTPIKLFPYPDYQAEGGPEYLPETPSITPVPSFMEQGPLMRAAAGAEAYNPHNPINDLFDPVAIAGIDLGNGLALIAPEGVSAASNIGDAIRGLTLIVDSPNSGQAFLAYGMLKHKYGLAKNIDYKVVQPVGNSVNRHNLLVNPTAPCQTNMGCPTTTALCDCVPADQRMTVIGGYQAVAAAQQGLTVLGGFEDATYPYQGSSITSTRRWLDANGDTATGVVRALGRAASIVEETYAVQSDKKTGYLQDLNLQHQPVYNTVALRQEFDGFETYQDVSKITGPTGAGGPYQYNPHNPINELFDPVAIAGMDLGNSLALIAPERISNANNIGDAIRGLTLIVDSPNSGQAFLAYGILKHKYGLVKDVDYKVVREGGAAAPEGNALREIVAALRALLGEDWKADLVAAKDDVHELVEPVARRVAAEGGKGVPRMTMIGGYQAIAAAQQGLTVVGGFEDATYPYQGGSITTTRRWLDANGDTATGVVRALGRAASIVEETYAVQSDKKTGYLQDLNLRHQPVYNTVALRQEFNGFETYQDVSKITGPTGGGIDESYWAKARANGAFQP
ncbi:hypothetical protein JKP88DRAFT_282915 [Tribonema minus]|uniref:Uncharacterized protein n=1 Tax=Tribonema minus TaxID=303371 RepID=A0A835YTE5_9STRA|nr:hypothetical protein JKP88DRAFT_282915 [Tribonema minus]